MSEQGPNDVAEVLAANESFYEALCGLDLDEMELVWWHGGEVRCIHPGWDVVVGWRAIRDSWQAIFASSPGLSVVPDEVEISMHDGLAWVQCLERISNSADDDEGKSFARATNLFVKKGDAWLLILHHASPVPAPQDSEHKAVH